MSLSHDCLYFELIGCCAGCRHKQVVVGSSFYYQTYGSLSPVQSSAILEYPTYRAPDMVVNAAKLLETMYHAKVHMA